MAESYQPIIRLQDKVMVERLQTSHNLNQTLTLPPIPQAALLRVEINALSKQAPAPAPASPMKTSRTSGKLKVDTYQDANANAYIEMWPEGDSKDPLARLPSRGNSQASSPNRSPSIRSQLSRSPSRRVNVEALASYERRMLALESELEEAKASVDEVHTDLRRRKESYMRREEALSKEIEVLKEELRVAKGERRESDATSAKGKSSETIQALHGQMTAELDNLLLKQEVALNYNSSVTIRAYADKLSSYESQIERDKDLKGNSLAQWLERTAAMVGYSSPCLSFCFDFLFWAES